MTYLSPVERVHMWEYRVLRKYLPGYHRVMDEPQYDQRVSVPLALDEQVLGLYENEPSSEDWIVVTTKGLHGHTADGWIVIPYDEIADVRTVVPRYPGPPKWSLLKELSLHPASRVLLIHTTSGRVVALPVWGTHGDHFDLFTFREFVLGMTRNVTRFFW